MLASTTLVAVATCKLAIAQSIQTDGTTTTRPENCSGNCNITDGLKQGNNLFHSFEKFNVDSGAKVLFEDSGVTNILGRVTGNEASAILGTLGVTGEANLFLINPNGIIFGNNSSLDVSGSFVATTADAVRFGEQGFFDTSPNEIPLLTINPSALLFYRGDRGNIVNESVVSEDNLLDLQVPEGKSLLLIGGDVRLDGGELNASGGRVELGGLTEAGEIQLNFSDINEGNISLIYPEQIKKANVSLTAASIDVVSSIGGDIAINADNIFISESVLLTGISIDSTSVNNQAGNITFNATKRTEIINDSRIANIANNVFSSDNNRDIDIKSGSLLISNKSVLQTSVFGTGNAGNININVPNGRVEISNNLELEEAVIATGVQKDVRGDSGNITINAKEILLTENSDIDASNLGQGDAGDINIFVEESIVMSFSNILNVINLGAIGNSGDINLEAKTLSLDGGSQITNAINGRRGEGGNIFIDISDSIYITGFRKNGFSSGITSTTQKEAVGNGGDITIKTDYLKISNGGLVSSQTSTEGNGGNIYIDAKTFEAVDSGQVVASADSSGNAGDITIKVLDNISLSGSDPNFAERIARFEENVGNEAPGNSGFFASSPSEASGSGGNITITTGELTLEDGLISTQAFSSDAGDIVIDAKNNIELRENSAISSLVSSGAGEGGDIELKAQAILAYDDSDIFSSAIGGEGGNIILDTPAFFGERFIGANSDSNLNPDKLDDNNRVDIDATGTVNGVVTLPNISFIQQDLEQLPVDTINTENLLATSCIERDESGSSFIVTGRGGLPTRPQDAVNSSFSTGTIQTLSSDSAVNPNDNKQRQVNNQIVEPTGVYRLPNGQLIISHECQ